jgi:hypothetical protein
MTSTPTAISDMRNMAQLQARAHALRLSGLLARWDQVVCDSARLAWVTELLGWEETERDRVVTTSAGPSNLGDGDVPF